MSAFSLSIRGGLNANSTKSTIKLQVPSQDGDND